MAKQKKTMTDKQFDQAVAKLNERTPIKQRGGRASAIIPNKKRLAEKKVCRGKVKE